MRPSRPDCPQGRRRARPALLPVASGSQGGRLVLSVGPAAGCVRARSSSSPLSAVGGIDMQPVCSASGGENYFGSCPAIDPRYRSRVFLHTARRYRSRVFTLPVTLAHVTTTPPHRA